jgi:hypothetical protein
MFIDRQPQFDPAFCFAAARRQRLLKSPKLSVAVPLQNKKTINAVALAINRSPLAGFPALGTAKGCCTSD